MSTKISLDGHSLSVSATPRSSAALEIIRRHAFQELKPKCISVSQLVLTAHLNPKLARDLSKALQDLLHTLQNIVQEDKNAISQGLGDYVFFPLSHVFRQQENLTDRVLNLTLQCVHVLIDSCWQVDINKDLAKQLMILITFMIGGKPGSDVPSKASDETKLAGCLCLKSLFTGLEKSIAIQKFLVTDENIPALGACITTLLEIQVNASSTDLQRCSAETLGQLLKCIVDDDVLANFFPGIVSQTCRSLDPRTNGQRKSKALAASINLLSHTMCFVLSDIKTLHIHENQAKQDNSNLKTSRTASWLKATTAQVQVALSGVLRLRSHRLVLVRRSLFSLCRDIVKKCSMSMEPSLPAIVESLVLFAVDKDVELQSESLSSLRSIVASQTGTETILQSSLHNWIASLSRVLLSNDEDKKTQLISKISVSLKLLGEHGLTSSILQDALSQNLHDGLSTLITLEDAKLDDMPSKVTSLEIVQVTSNPVFPLVLSLQKSQQNILSNIKDMIEMLGESPSGLSLAQEHIAEARISNPENQASSLWIAIHAIKGSLKQEDWLIDSSATLNQRRAIEELYSVSLSCLLDTYDDTQASPLNNCMALEAIALSAEYMKSEFRTELVEALYLVVHLLGSPSMVVQNHAIVCINIIAQSCNYPSVKKLLLDNVDYMINAISLKLNIFDLSPQAPTVLLMMIKLAGSSLMPYLDDLIGSIFAALDNFHGYGKLTELLFAVLKGIVEESAKGDKSQFLLTSSTHHKPQQTKRGKYGLQQLLDEVGAFGVERDHLEPLSVEENDDKDEQSSAPQEPWGKPKPSGVDHLDDSDPSSGSNPNTSSQDISVLTPSYKTLQSITRLSQDYLTYPSPQLRQHLLQLITTASPSLSLQESAYLPLIHQIWPTVVLCLSNTTSNTGDEVINDFIGDQLVSNTNDNNTNTNANVTIAALDTITQLITDAKDFLTSRIIELWPTIRKLYMQYDGGGHVSERGNPQSKQRQKKTQNVLSLPTYTIAYRVGHSVQKLVEAIVQYLKVEDRIMDDILEIGFADGESGGNLRDILEEKGYGDAVWLALNMVGDGIDGSHDDGDDRKKDDDDDGSKMKRGPNDVLLSSGELVEFSGY